MINDYRVSVSRNLAYIRAMVCLVQRMDFCGFETLFLRLNSVVSDCFSALLEADSKIKL